MSAVRQNYHEECEAAVNKQINMELYASYVYLAMSYHFDRDDVASNNFYTYYEKQSGEERERAQKLMRYQNMRGGRIVFHDIKAPAETEWKMHINTLEDALALEKKVNESLLQLRGIANKHNDPHLCDFLETEFLDEQVKSIKEISDMITNMKRCGHGLGVYQFEKLTMASVD